MIDSIIHRFTGMSSVVFSPLYHYQYSFSYLYFDVTPYVVRHIMIYRYPANPLYRYQHIPVYPYSDVTPYTARHSFGTLMLSSGIPIESIAKMMGHTNINSTQVYA